MEISVCDIVACVYTFNFSQVSGMLRGSETTSATTAAKQIRDTEQSLLPDKFCVLYIRELARNMIIVKPFCPHFTT